MLTLRSKYIAVFLTSCSIILGLAMAGALTAGPNGNAVTSHPTSQLPSSEKATEFVKNLIEEAKRIADNPKAGRHEFGQFLEKNTNIETITAFILGRLVKKLGNEKSKEFSELYRKRLIQTYSTPEKIKTFRSSTYEFKGKTSQNSDGSFLIKTQFTFNEQQASKPVQVNFIVIQKDGNLYIYDITFDGISKLSAERSEYQSIGKRFYSSNDSFKSDEFLKYLNSTLSPQS